MPAMEVPIEWIEQTGDLARSLASSSGQGGSTR
jgi:hypothetical protein